MRGKKTRISKSVFVEHHLGDSAVAGEWGGVSVRPAGGERAARPRDLKPGDCFHPAPQEPFQKNQEASPNTKTRRTLENQTWGSCPIWQTETQEQTELAGRGWA